ncbi:Fucose permease [Microbulbifer thermotolerans]|uniref:MFS transporter n=1 Tax=Microbulbifer thermotolerans TaxID=252514 RepID=UPI0008E6024A|nr:MFS transporter [Microbulbifer thermotolerans]MCX2835448.1 MFS transporter [Microbulbifer thermotolerans]MCX2842376.1 MFS transporter [Microbulbifer thermotolerans]SFC50924.1 Fucose permease [Microbulbifer thermotolerans]
MTSPAQYPRSKLFLIGVLALFTAAMSASLRATVAGNIKTELLDAIDLARSATLIAEALGVAFLGFAFTLFAVSPFLDLLGMRRVVIAAGTCLGGGTLLTICAPLLGGEAAYRVIWGGMLLCGIGWGCVEATINPMTTALYPEQKTHRLNVLHAWWPAGMIAGGLAGVVLGTLNISWQWALALVLLPASAVILLSLNTPFPPTERAANGISMGEMFAEIVRRPSFFIWFGAMLLTAASELAPGQWVDLALTQKVGFRGMLLLVYVSGLMFVMRHFAGPLAHRLSNAGLLWFSSLLAALGLWLLSQAQGPITALLAATVWGTGVCFMWPTMLASVSERYPRGGSLMIGLLGSAGALSIYFVLPMLGAYYDQVKAELAGGSEHLSQLSAEALAEIQGLAAAESFALVALLPMALLLVFGAIWLYDRRSSAAPEPRTVEPG